MTKNIHNVHLGIIILYEIKESTGKKTLGLIM